MASILSDIGTNIGSELKSLDLRLSSAETSITNLGGQVPPPTGSFTIEPVTWTNLTEINLSGEKLSNISFDPPPLGLGVDVEVIVQWINGGKTASVGQIYTIDLVQPTGGMRLAGNGHSLFASAAQLTTNVVALHPWESNPSYALPIGDDPPPNGWGWEEFVIDIQVKWVGASTNNHTQGNVYQANAYRPAWTNYSGNIRIKNDSDNYGWVGNNRGTDWEVVNRAPYLWTVNNGTIDQAKLSEGIIKGSNSVRIDQMFSSPLAIGTKIVVKATRSDLGTGGVAFKHLKADGNAQGDNIFIPVTDGFVEYEVVTSQMHGIGLSTQHGTREISSVSVFQGEVSGGTVQAYTGGSIGKIAGSAGYNAGASSVQKIDGQKDGYVQFQIEHLSHSVRVGLVYLDHDYTVDPPFFMNFGNGNIDLTNPWLENYEPFVAGDWFRIRHYSLENEIKFQKRQPIYQVNTSASYEVGTKIMILRDFSSALKDEIVTVYFVNNSGVPSFEQDDGTQFGAQAGITGYGRTDWWEVAESIGEDYVTFYTHPTFTNGSDLYIDTSFHFIGSRINDTQIAYK